jgi:voltage-gated potassium channel
MVFTVEYFARVWSAVDNPWKPDHAHPVKGRIRYMLTWFAIIDVIAIAPFYLSMFTGADLRILRALRLLRIFKLTRYSSAMTMLLQVFREETRTIGAAMFVSMLMMIMGATLAFIFEHKAQPEAFSSIPAAMYWAIITMTTVGYGDMVPITVYGKIVGAFISIIGLGMVALPAGILASGFNNALHRRRVLLEERVQDAMEDGVIDGEEQQQLDTLVQRLNLNKVDVTAIIKAVQHQKMTAEGGVCPHCHLPLDQVVDDDD